MDKRMGFIGLNVKHLTVRTAPIYMYSFTGRAYVGTYNISMYKTKQKEVSRTVCSTAVQRYL